MNWGAWQELEWVLKRQCGLELHATRGMCCLGLGIIKKPRCGTVKKGEFNGHRILDTAGENQEAGQWGDGNWSTDHSISGTEGSLTIILAKHPHFIARKTEVARGEMTRGQHLDTGHRPGAALVQEEAWEAREHPHAELGRFTPEAARDGLLQWALLWDGRWLQEDLWKPTRRGWGIMVRIPAPCGGGGCADGDHWWFLWFHISLRGGQALAYLLKVNMMVKSLILVPQLGGAELRPDPALPPNPVLFLSP